MELTKRDRTIKYTVFGVIIFMAGLLQNVLSYDFEIAGARCFIVVPVAVILGINEDEKTAALYGLFAGTILDMVSVQHKGYSCIFIMLACYISAALAQFVFRNTFWFNLVSAVVAIVLYCVIYWLLFVLIGAGEGRAASLLWFYLPSALYTVLLTPIVYFILNPLKNKLNKVENIEEN